MFGIMKKDWYPYAGFALGAGGLIYWFIFRHGLDKAVYLQGVLFLFSFLVPIALNELVIRGYLDDSSGIFRLGREAGAGPLLAAGTVVFLVFHYFSVRALERERLS